MNDLTQISEVFAGLLNIYIVKSTDVTFGDTIEGVLQEITLSGSDYTKLPFRYNSADYQSSAQIKSVAVNDNSIEMFLSGNNLDQVKEFTAMDGNTYILIFQDRLKNFWCVGTPEIPLRFIDKYSSGKAMKGANGRKLTFEQDNTISMLYLESDPTILDTLLFTVSNNVSIVFTTSETKTLFCRTSDGQEFEVLCNPSGTLNITNLPTGGTIEVFVNYEFLIQINAANENYITAVDGLDLIPQLEVLLLTNNDITDIDVTSLINLENLGLAQNTLNSLTLPTTNTLEILSASQLDSLDMSPAPKLRYLLLSNNNFTTLDFSVLDLDITTNYIDVQHNSFNQAAVDQIISDILDAIIISGKAGTLNIQNNVAPSASGLADINTLEVTYGWTVNHD
jgi:hypothetical protein